VTAVMALAPGSSAPALEELRAHCAPHLADYKLPKGIVIVPEVGRAPNGKPDYESAKRAATGAA
jgi:acyl-CoA synthetase (AMP-forming)/AMP-acid ligase II